MSTDNTETIADEPLHLLDDLQSLLEKQTKLAQRGNIGDVELLSKQASSIVGKIAQAGILQSPKFKNQRGQLRKLYEELCLTITAQEADITEKLNHVRKGRKTIRTYRSNT
jgi:hypothetical protein